MVAELHLFGVNELKAALASFEARAVSVTPAAVAEGAHIIERLAKQNAPVTTGTLRRSVRVFGPTSAGPGTWAALIGPTAIYGRRVELGFHGTDRLGRSYSQAGQPYLGPAFDSVVGGGLLTDIFAKHWGKALGR